MKNGRNSLTTDLKCRDPSLHLLFNQALAWLKSVLALTIII